MAHAHSRHHARPVRRWWIAGTAIVVVAGGLVALTATRSSGSSMPVPNTGRVVTTATPPLAVADISPANGSTGVLTDATITVQLTHRLAATSPLPSLAPAVPGTWQQVSPGALTFVPSGPWVPSSSETVTVPGGSTGIVDDLGRRLTQPVTTRFTVETGSTLRLQQLLAQLNYLPVSFSPAAPLDSPQESAQPQPGSFQWRWSEPTALVSLWTPGTDNVITRGAVMAFESHHQMQTDGSAGPAVWAALLADAASGAATTDPYNYVFVSKPVPQSVTVYSDGAAVYSTAANTGVAAAPTESGTYPVYQRFLTQTMTGTNPNGSKYSDPGIPWVSYFHGGDALHGFVRSSYGWPQSDGCVEMPPANAKVVFPLTPIGTLVTIS